MLLSIADFRLFLLYIFIAYNFVCLCVHLYTVQKYLGMHDNLHVYVGGRQSEISPRAQTLPGQAQLCNVLSIKGRISLLV